MYSCVYVVHFTIWGNTNKNPTEVKWGNANKNPLNEVKVTCTDKHCRRQYVVVVDVVDHGMWRDVYIGLFVAQCASAFNLSFLIINFVSVTCEKIVFTLALPNTAGFHVVYILKATNSIFWLERILLYNILNVRGCPVAQLNYLVRQKIPQFPPV